MKTNEIFSKIKNHFYQQLGSFYRNTINPMKIGTNYRINEWNTLEGFNYNIPIVNVNFTNTKIIAHAFWHGLIGEKQLFSIKSFLCTQDLKLFDIWLWLDEDSISLNKNNKAFEQLLKSNQFPIVVKKWDVFEQIEKTPFANIKWYFKWNRPLASIADDFRVIALYKYGGLYFDLDIMFCKSLSPLLMGPEFVYAWEKQPFANSALLFIRKDSYINNELSKTMIRRKSSQPWAIFKYSNRKIKWMMVYPCQLFDPLWLGYTEGMPIKSFDDFFKEFDTSFIKDEHIHSYTDFFEGIYAYHWHNRWNVPTCKNSYFGYFNDLFNNELNLSIL